MRYPSPEDEMVLHRRLLDHDPVAPADVFLVYMDRLAKILERRFKYDVDIARDAALDAVVAYRGQPERFDPRKSRLFSYIVRIARYKAVDRWRSSDAQARREKEKGDVELLLRTPNEEMEKMETFVRARQLVGLLERGGALNERDRALLVLVLSGEGSTEELAKVLGLPPMPKIERQREVKRNRDRLMRRLERLGEEEEEPDDES